MSTVCPWSNGPLRPRTFVLLLVLLILAKFALAALPAAEPTANELLARVYAHQGTKGFNMRGRVEVKSKDAAKPSVIQIRALGKSDGNSSRMLYQALWPDAIKGQAVVLDRPTHQTVDGFFFKPPDTTVPITPAQYGEAILGTDMTVEDLADEYLWWPNAAFAGDDKVGKDPCRAIESRPPAGAQTAYAMIRSCVSTSKLLTLRVEKLRADGKIAKRFTVKRSIRSSDFVVTARTLEIENVERGSVTTIDITSGDRGIVTATIDFSVAKLKSLGK